MRKPTYRTFWIGASVLVLALIAVGLVVRGGGSNSTTPVATRLDPSLRTVVIAEHGETLPSLKEGFLRAQLVSGQIPSEIVKATVRTDTDCAPDQAGVSHCTNLLELGSKQVVVQHHHKMSEVACLTPGEQVNVIRAAAYEGL
jgi:hypothetical protein